MVDKTETHIGAVLKYNPHLWSTKELRAIFVARKKELQQIIKCISDTKANIVPQHILITGHRGMGKSTLLQRIALAVEDHSELSKTWLALRFPEEQYTVSTLEELWANVLGSLADTLDEQGNSDHSIDAFMDNLEQTPEAEREKQALEYLQQWCDQHQRRLLLLMDSSDLLLANLSHSGTSKKVDAGATQLWRLRQTLQNDPRFFWLGGSYEPLEAEALYHDAFLDFFYSIELKPLSVDEMQRAIQELARVFGLGHGLKGEEAVDEISRTFEQHPERLKTLHRLTGGNLRTTVTLYELFSAGGENQVQADLKRLLDLMTPLYKHRLESLADQPRKILAHLFEHWAPISLAELTTVSGLKKASLSSQLLRLEQEGLIEKTALPATKSKGYQVTERFFNIWYLMRNAPRRVRMSLSYLVKFMGLWYSSAELNQLAMQQQEKYSNGQAGHIADYEYSRALAATLSEQNPLKYQLDWTVFRKIRKQLQQQLPDLFDLHGDDKPFATSEDYLQRLEALPEKLQQCPLGITNQALLLWESRVMGSVSLSLEEKERIAASAHALTQPEFEQLNKVFIEESEKFSKQYGQDAWLIMQKAVQQGDFFPDCPDSELAYSQLISCFNKNIYAAIFALNLFEKKYHDQNVEKAYRYLITLGSEQAYLWNGLGNLLQLHLKRYDESEQAYRQAIVLDSEYAYPWNGLGCLLKNYLKRYKESEQAYRQAIALDSEYAFPWNSLGNLLLDHLRQYNDAELAFRKSIELDQENAFGYANLARALLAQQKNTQEVASLYRIVIEKAPEDNPQLLLQAHLYLDNRDLAIQALNVLAEQANAGDALAFFRIKEQCVECHAIALGTQLAELMQKSPYTAFLQPFILALQSANGDDNGLLAAPVEIADMARNVLSSINEIAD